VRLRASVIDMSRPDVPLKTTAEAARLLGIHPRTLTKYVRLGKVKPTMRLPSGQFRWDMDDIRRQLADLDPDDG
jgi:predicted site-specific integrase-resolvase